MFSKLSAFLDIFKPPHQREEGYSTGVIFSAIL